MRGRSILWISGWSIPPEWLAGLARRHLPGWIHEATAPSARAVPDLAASDADMLGGFSFGASLLMRADDPRPRLLLAPFGDLKSEAGLGGAVATTRIRQQLRQLRRDPAAALADFRRLIGVPDFSDALDEDELAWGLGEMLSPERPVPSQPAGTVALAGESDPLLHIPTLQGILPDLHVVACRHNPEPLLATAAAILQDHRP